MSDRMKTILALPERALKVLFVLVELDRPADKAELCSLLNCSWNPINVALTTLEHEQYKLVISSGSTKDRKYVATQAAKKLIIPSLSEGILPPKGATLKGSAHFHMGEQHHLPPPPDGVATSLNLLKLREVIPSNNEGILTVGTGIPSDNEGIQTDVERIPSTSEGIRNDRYLGAYDAGLRVRQKEYIADLLGFFGRDRATIVGDADISPSALFAHYYLWLCENETRRHDPQQKLGELKLGALTHRIIHRRRTNKQAQKYAEARMKYSHPFTCPDCGPVMISITLAERPNETIHKCPDCEAVMQPDALPPELLDLPPDVINQQQHEQALRALKAAAYEE